MPTARARSEPYDPDTEQDRLIREHIEMNWKTGEAKFRNVRYPVWAIVLNLKATDFDRERVLGFFPELSMEAITAAERFWELHADDLRDYLE